MTGREVVDADNCLAQGQEFLKEIGADEASDSGDNPDPWRSNQSFAKMAIGCGDHELTVEGYPPS
jgi:hypothetical protein